MVKISVVISTYTEERLEDVKRCIRSLKNQTKKPDEIILVLDPIEDLIEFYSREIGNDVKIVKSDGFGLSNARNKGIKVAKGNIIAFIDDDAWADERWLENLLKNFENDKVWVVGGKIVPVFDEKRPKWLAEELDWIVGCTYKGMPIKRSEIRNPIGANMAFRREVFDVCGKFKTEIGRYGKKLIGGEETELCLRLKRLKPNVKIIYDPSAIVYHRVPKSRTKITYALRRAYYEGYSKAILSKEYELSTEIDYLKSLLKSTMSKVLNPNKLPEVLCTIFVILFTALGNVHGRFLSLARFDPNDTFGC